MRAPAAAAPVEGFFLAAQQGQRFCLFHPPAGPCRGAMLYAPPFGEEMNKARRMAALQARALAADGIGVLLLDLYGTGDSSGDFADARWDMWKHDLALGHQWLATRLGVPVSLWGLRLGALLALDYARAPALPVHSLVLWQPVLSGSTFLTQFLRLRVANEMLGDGGDKSGGTRALRERLRTGTSLEIAGYELAPALADALDEAEAGTLVPPVPVTWFELAATADKPLTPASARTASAWREGGVQLDTVVVAGQPFWATVEVTECDSLLTATSAAFAGGDHAV